jgi:tRNA-uridine 2-sulfurtransferase
MMEKRTVLVAMSGGVDSSVAAALLVEQGHRVIGVTMKTFCYSGDGPSKTCCGLDGIMDAKRVADRLGIPHYVFDVEREFNRDVIEDFVGEYAAAAPRTRASAATATRSSRDLLRRGEMLGCDAIAPATTPAWGHGPDGEPALLRGLDRDKDQAYFLWALPREILPQLLFPLGELTKPEVRRRRARWASTAEKPRARRSASFPPATTPTSWRRGWGPSTPRFRKGRW